MPAELPPRLTLVVTVWPLPAFMPANVPPTGEPLVVKVPLLLATMVPPVPLLTPSAVLAAALPMFSVMAPAFLSTSARPASWPLLMFTSAPVPPS